MKKYIVFILSFGLLYVFVQLLSGWLLTAHFVPELTITNHQISQEVSFGQTSITPFFMTLLAATIAYYFSQQLFTNKNKNKDRYILTDD